MIQTTIMRADSVKARALVCELLETGRQFAVAPFPNDLQSREVTGWVVSYPPAPVEQPEPTRAVA